MGCYVRRDDLPLDVHNVAILRRHGLSFGSADSSVLHIGHHLPDKFWQRLVPVL